MIHISNNQKLTLLARIFAELEAPEASLYNSYKLQLCSTKFP